MSSDPSSARVVQCVPSLCQIDEWPTLMTIRVRHPRRGTPDGQLKHLCAPHAGVPSVTLMVMLVVHLRLEGCIVSLTVDQPALPLPATDRQAAMETSLSATAWTPLRQVS